MTTDIISQISQIISTVGFPIFVAAYLLWDASKARKDHKEEMDKMTNALNNNTEAIVKLTDRIKFTIGTRDVPPPQDRVYDVPASSPSTGSGA